MTHPLIDNPPKVGYIPLTDHIFLEGNPVKKTAKDERDWKKGGHKSNAERTKKERDLKTGGRKANRTLARKR